MENLLKQIVFKPAPINGKHTTAGHRKKQQEKKLYAHADGTCNFIKPTDSTGSVSYVSDPAKPVPYRTEPIEATYGEGSRWYTWHVEDQRFVSSRPDVISFTSDSMKENFTVTGNVTAHIFVSTTGTMPTLL